MIIERTYVFANDLLQGCVQNAPRKHLHVLLDIARLRAGECHDEPEELGAVGFRLRNGDGTEALQVASDAILLLHSESDGNERLEQRDGVDAGNVAFTSVFPPDAAHADAVRRSILERDGLEAGTNDATALTAAKLDQSSLRLPFRRGPFLRHRIQLAFDLEHGFGVGRIHHVRVERMRRGVDGSRRRWLQCRRPNQGRVDGVRRIWQIRRSGGRRKRARLWTPRRGRDRGPQRALRSMD